MLPMLSFPASSTCVTGIRHAGRWLNTCSARLIVPQARRRQAIQVRAQDDGQDSPDWDAEMSLFKKRISKPNQLGTMRRVLEKVDTGKVLFCQEGLSIVEGLVNDAPVGAVLQFSNGAQGVLLWRRSDNICFGLVLDSADVAVGDTVECKVKGILQVVDENDGPTMKREFEAFSIYAGESLRGQAVDYLCRPLKQQQPPPTTATTAATAAATNGDADAGNGAADAGVVVAAEGPSGGGGGFSPEGQPRVPLFNYCPDMESREQINQPLLTGVMALDTLTPLGRGQTLMVTGPAGGGQTDTTLDCIVGQRNTGVRCVYAASGRSRAHVAQVMEVLQREGALEYTTVVAAYDDAPLGERYAALCAACSLGEATRDAGGHSLVVLDDASCMPVLWERITCALADLGLKAMELQDGDSESVEEGGEEALVEYEGMLVSAAAAQRRRFFSSVIQRAAKMAKRLGGGTMTLLPVLLGQPATGEGQKARGVIAQYKHLSEGQKAKLLAALDKKQQQQQQQQAQEDKAAAASASSSSGGSIDQATSQVPGSSSAGDGFSGGLPTDVRTEVVEEWMSITDGQVVQRRAAEGDAIRIDPQQSISRIGSRAYHEAMEQLAPAVRLELAQAADAQRFAADPTDPVVIRKAQYAARVAAALQHQPRTLLKLEEQVVMLYALQNGFVDRVDPPQVGQALERVLATLRTADPALLQEVAQEQALGEETEARLQQQLRVVCTLLKSCDAAPA